MRQYFCFSGRSDEIEAIKEIKPDNLLISYFYFKNKSIADLFQSLKYSPNILLDSGAYSAFTQRKEINLQDYIDYIKNNQEYIENYINLDVIRDSKKSFENFQIMGKAGLNPLPVFHYGEDYYWLDDYISLGENHICLGGTVPEKNKINIANWINKITNFYPEMKFHLLGSSSKKIIQLTNLYSFDSSTWVKMAFNGKYKLFSNASQREKKIKIMKFLLKEKEDYQEMFVF